jgi:hypothetical protein
MRTYRFIVEMQNGKCYGVIASSFTEAQKLVEAWCILMGLKYDLDITTGEVRNIAPRSLVEDGPARFEKEWEACHKITLAAR